MIKRPFIPLLCAYLAGILLAWYRMPFHAVIPIALSGCLLLYLMMFRVKNRLISRRDGFLWSLPLLLLLGYTSMGEQMKPPDPDHLFEEEAECILSGEVDMVITKQWGRVIYLKNNRVRLPGGGPYPVENVLLNLPKSSDQKDYLVGNQVTVSGKIQKFSEATNPGQFNEQMYYKILNIDYKVKAEQITVTDANYIRFRFLLDRLKQKLLTVYETILPKKQAGTLMAMLLGEKYLLNEEVNELYRENGISHIIAISGLHVSLLGQAIYLLLKRLKTGLIPAVVISIAFLYCYGLLTNFSVSTNRAVVMFAVMLVARILGKTYDMLSAISLSAFLILLQNPMLVLSAGFLLSFGAVLGIAVIYPCLKSLLPSKKTILNGFYISISAQLMTLPFLLFFFFQLPVYSIFINLLILPCMSFLVLSAMAAGIAGAFYLPFGVYFAGGANYILIFYEWVCRIGSRLPGNLLTVGKPGMLRVLIYFILIAFFIWGTIKFKKKALLVVPVLAVFFLILPKSNSGLKITMLDVGQGEAIYMETKGGTTFFIDGGSTDISKVGKNRIQPFLLASGVDRIDYAIISHADEDHTNGLKELMAGGRIKIRHLVLPDIRDSDSEENINSEHSSTPASGLLEDYHTLEKLAMENGVELLYIKAGDMIREGEPSLTCLHPRKGYRFSSNNAYSMVLGVSYSNFDMLLTGDLEPDGEEALIRHLSNAIAGEMPPVSVDYDVLKVAHHGSGNTTTVEFLDAIKPEYALISCSRNNRYAHPHPETLERLHEAGSDVITTFDSGAITIMTDGEKMNIMEYTK